MGTVAIAPKKNIFLGGVDNPNTLRYYKVIEGKEHRSPPEDTMETTTATQTIEKSEALLAALDEAIEASEVALEETNNSIEWAINFLDESW